MAVMAAPQVADPPTRQPRSWRLVVAAPELAVSAFAGFALPAMVLLLVGRFSPGWVLPFGIAGAAIAMAIRGLGDERVDRRTVLWTLAAAGVVIAWVVANAFFSAENIFAHRDPATYDLAGRWLMDHSRLPIATHPEIFGSPIGLGDASAGFGNTLSGVGHVYAQGNHLLPAMLAVVGWLFGTAAMLKANLVFGAIALFGFFSLARRVVSAPLALLAMSALAVSMPMIFVSRDTYSEPLAMLFLIGGLALLQRAVVTGRVRDFGLAGVVAGMAAPARIDSDASLLAIIVLAAVLMVFAAVPRRRHAVACAVALLGAAAVPALIGWLDVSLLSSGYYRDERQQIMLLIKAGFVLLALLPFVVAIAWRPAVQRWLARPALPRRATIVLGTLIVTCFVALASRPFWMQTRARYLGFVTDVQRSVGDRPDGTRTYNEQTVRWLAMYMGWPTVVLAVAGYVLLVRRSIRQRSLATVAMLTMGLGITLLYTYKSQITPDQPWAIRRYVPVVLPLLVLAATYAVCVLLRQRARRVRAAGVLGAVAVLVVPAIVTAPAADIREEAGQLGLVQRICAQVSPGGAVVELDQPSLEGYAQTMRSYCGVPSIGLLKAAPTQLAQVQQAVHAHGLALYAISQDVTAIPFAAGHAPAGPFYDVTTTRWPSTLHGPPTKASKERVTIYLVRVRADGFAEPVKGR